MEITFFPVLGMAAFVFVHVSLRAQPHNVPRACFFVRKSCSNVFFAPPFRPDSSGRRGLQLLFRHALSDGVVHEKVDVVRPLEARVNLPFVFTRMGWKGT